MNITIVVTRGDGFFGSNFIFHLLKEYPEYRAVRLDKLTYAGNLSTLAMVMDHPHFRFVKLDICDREEVFRLFDEEYPDIIVNFAAESHVDCSIEDPGVFFRPISSVLQRCWMPVVNMASLDFIKYLQTKSMVIFAGQI